MYGNPEVTTGGRALKFYATMRIEVRRVEAIKVTGGEIIGNRTRCKIVKNKVAPPFKEAEFDILYGKGINKNGELVDLGAKFDIIHKSGSWFSYEGRKLGQGRDAIRDILNSDPAFADEIEAKVKAAIKADADAKQNSEAVKSETVTEPEVPKASRAKLDIVVDEDE